MSTRLWIYLTLLAPILAACNIAPDRTPEDIARIITGLPPTTAPDLPAVPEAPVISADSLFTLARQYTAPVLAAKYQQMDADLAIQTANASFWPQVNLSPSINYPINGQWPDEAWEFRELSTVNLSINWNLFHFIIGFRDQQIAQRRVQMARLNAQLARKEACAKAVALYLDYWAAHTEDQLANHQLTLALAMLEDAGYLHRTGQLSSQDLQQAQRRLIEARRQRHRIQRALKSARWNLLAFLGQPQHTRILRPPKHLQPPTLAPMAHYLDSGMRHSEQLQSAQIQIGIARDAVDWAPLQRWINISTGLTFGQDLLRVDHVEEKPIYVSFQWNIPIFDAGANARLQRSAQLGYLRALLNRRQTANQVDRETRLLVDTVHDAYANHQMTALDTHLAAAQLNDARARFAKGRIAKRELEQIEIQWQLARQQELNAWFKAVAHHVALEYRIDRDPQLWFHQDNGSEPHHRKIKSADRERTSRLTDSPRFPDEPNANHNKQEIGGSATHSCD